MSEVLISLGSGCAVAQILDELGLRKQSLPFDWLWNLDRGLELVSEIINDDFVNYTHRDKLVRDWHYRWNDPVLIHSSYPNIAHVHSDPLSSEKDYLTLIRRVQRFQELLNGKDKIIFIYFRSFDETYYNKLQENNHSIFYERILNESKEFVELMHLKYPLLIFNLISICQIPFDQVLKDKPFIKNIKEQSNDCLDIEISYSESKNNVLIQYFLNIIAHTSWIYIFYKRKYIGIIRFIYTIAKYPFRQLLKR